MILQAWCPVHRVDLDGQLQLIEVDPPDVSGREWVVDTSNMMCPAPKAVAHECAQEWVTRVLG